MTGIRAKQDQTSTMICANGSVKLQHIPPILVLHEVGQDIDDLRGVAQTFVFHQCALWRGYSIDSGVWRRGGISGEEDAVEIAVALMPAHVLDNDY
jgi:hypothetical protein